MLKAKYNKETVEDIIYVVIVILRQSHGKCQNYSKFVHIVHYALQEVKEKEFSTIGIKMKGIKPLPVFKQIMTLFCDINEGVMGDSLLKDYLLYRTSTVFNRERYRLYMHIHSGYVERMNGIMVQFTSVVGLITLSERTTYPVGFTLYIDKPEVYKQEGVEITLFSEFNYDDKGEVDIIIPKLESNIFFSGDYRTKEEFEYVIRENKMESKTTSCSGVNLLTGGFFDKISKKNKCLFLY